ncbi:MAG: hypothetical protein PHD97_06710 [Bacteroidales bacterium]|nr:hypothetical protein [Bacteroidales bacterium]
MRKIIIVSVSIILLGILSCKTDFDLNANWKDITVVYGLLNPDDSVQFVKINKAYLGEGNAIAMAANPDSTTYPDGTLEVKVEQWKNGSLAKTFILHDTLIIDKESGIFPSPQQKLFCFYTNPATTSAVDRESTYKLYVKNVKTNKVISSSTTIVKKMLSSDIYPTSSTMDFTANAQRPIKWKSVINGRKYEAVLRFWYVEINTSTNDSVERYIDWNIGSRKSMNLTGGENLELNYLPNTFYQYIGGKIAVNSGLSRRVGKLYENTHHLDLIIAVAHDDLTTYMDVNEPSNNIVQERPQYTNVTDGIGIFSSRYFDTNKKKFSTFSQDSLTSGIYTRYQNFFFRQ